jgi:hypothetical protein
MSLEALAGGLNTRPVSSDLTGVNFVQEEDKARLIYFLLIKKGDLEKVAAALGPLPYDVRNRILIYGLNLSHYQGLGSKVGQHAEEVNEANPYELREKSSSLADRLNEFGWRRHCLKGMELWEKGPAYTSMSARVVLDHNSDYIDFISFEIYGPDNTPIKSIIQVFPKSKNLISGRVQRRRRSILNIAESYLSGATNIKEFRAVYNRHLIKDPQGTEVMRGLAQLREYVSGGIIAPEEFHGSMELVRKYSLNSDQVRYLRSAYVELDRADSFPIGFGVFIESSMANPVFAKKLLKTKWP